MKYSKKLEGNTFLYVPNSNIPKASDEVFYNPVMELNRDLSIAFVKSVKPNDFCDLLAASGARGIRIANETGVEVTLNDANPTAVDLIKKNAGINNVEVGIENMYHRQLLADRIFDFIDVDPFGPPTPYLDDAFSSITGKGHLAVTATDTSALCGTYPTACKRKYSAKSLRTDCYDEVGMRILLGYIASTGLRHGLASNFKFSHSSNHYFRTYLQVGYGSKKIKDCLKKIGFLQYCPKCLYRRYSRLDDLLERCGCGIEFSTAGPLWMGETADKDVCDLMHSEFISGKYGSKKIAVSLIEKIRTEQTVNLPYINIHKLFKKKGVSPEKTRDVIKQVKENGFECVGTHYNPLGIKTDAWPVF